MSVCVLCSAFVSDMEAHRDFHWQAGQWPRCRELLPGHEKRGSFDYSGECVLRKDHQGEHFVDLGTWEKVEGIPLVVRPTGERKW
jgi:hypothetical protein